MKYYIDCEFDGHNGPLLSMAVVRNAICGVHIRVLNDASDPWVIQNVLPLMDKHKSELTYTTPEFAVGAIIRTFLDGDDHPIIIADSPVDICRFCQAITTGTCGEWASVDYSRMTFEVHNVECYPTELEGAVQHNAWWDAMALREKLDHQPSVAEAMRIVDRRRLDALGTIYLELGNVISVDGQKQVIREPRHLHTGEKFVCKTPHEDGDFSYCCGSDYCRCWVA